MTYIRKGAYSKIVQEYFKTAILDATNSCACEEYSFDARCLDTYFVEADFKVRKLKELLEEELLMPEEKRRFPLYRVQGLPQPSYLQSVLVSYELELLLQGSSTASQIKDGHWKGANFAADEILFEDNLLDIGDACASLMDQVGEDKRMLSASFLTGYVIGVFQKVRFNGANVNPVLHFMSSYFQSVFNAARCYRKSGNGLRIPVSLVLDFVPTALRLINDAKKLKVEMADKDLPHLYNMQSTAMHAVFGYKETIKQLCSLMSFGVTRQYLEMDGKTLKEMDVKKLSMDKALLTTSYNEYVAFYKSRGRHVLIDCPQNGTWTFIERFGVPNPYMQCCSAECTKFSSSPLNLYIDREICCEGCNYLDCPGPSSHSTHGVYNSGPNVTSIDGASGLSKGENASGSESTNVVI